MTTRLISTLVTQKTLTYFKLDHATYYGIAYEAITNLAENTVILLPLIIPTLVPYISKKVLTFSLLIGVAVAMWFFRYTFKRKNSITVHDTVNYREITKYLVDGQTNGTLIQLSSQHYCLDEGARTGLAEGIYQFIDNNYSIRITVEYKTDIETEDECKVTHRSLTISTYDHIDLKQYVQSIVKLDGHKTCVVLYHLRDCADHCNRYSMIYAGDKITDDKCELFKQLETNYIGTFFQKDHLRYWEYMKIVHFHPEKILNMGQYPQISLCLWGPPGTGKSTFAYRVAMSLQRHIVNIDCKNKNKKTLIQIITNPQINGIWLNPKDCVFVFDEFDRSVKYLMDKEQSIQRFRENILNGLSRHDSEDDEDKDDRSTKNLKRAAKIRKTALKTTEPATATLAQKDHINGYIDLQEVYLKALSHINSELVVSDLLDILQGTAPIPGMICIATTNNLDQLKEYCPALFRHGRLLPVHFDNADKEVFTNIIRHYYPDHVSELDHYDLERLNLSTAHIIHHLIENYTTGNPLNKLLSDLNIRCI